MSEAIASVRSPTTLYLSIPLRDKYWYAFPIVILALLNLIKTIENQEHARDIYILRCMVCFKKQEVAYHTFFILTQQQTALQNQKSQYIRTSPVHNTS